MRAIRVQGKINHSIPKNIPDVLGVYAPSWIRLPDLGELVQVMTQSQTLLFTAVVETIDLSTRKYYVRKWTGGGKNGRFI